MPDREDEALKVTTADETRLLPGEEPSSQVRGDANHWIDVYSQLRQTKMQLIQSLKDMMEGQSPDVQRELERADLRMLELQVARFERRLAFWHTRLADLHGDGTSQRREAAAQSERE